jgi:enterochelin esterase family protein
LRHPDGGTEEICDPGNPLRAPGAFGDKSVVEFPDYHAPAWLTAERTGEYIEIPEATIWTPDDPREPLPLLVAHDGPEYDRLASLTLFAAAAADKIRHRVALLQPGDRNKDYAVSPAYRKALGQDIIPAITKTVNTSKPVVGMGASLGALAMLHAQRTWPGLLGGLFLQSGSFFTPELDPQERGFSGFTRITWFVDHVRRSLTEPVPVTITCGLAEENLANNRQMAVTLRAQGFPVDLVEVPDAHNYVGWRDAFDPALTDLLRRVWEGRDAT